MDQSELITTEARGHCFLIGLNRAQKRNAFTTKMLAALAQAFTTYEDNEDLRCAVLFAHGDHFTGGLDLAEVGPKIAAGAHVFPEDCVDPMDIYALSENSKHRRRTKPLVCAVQGYCFTIGIELLLSADIRIAAANTQFAQIEVQRGIMPFGGATMRFPLVAGWGNAMRYLLTGDRFGAEEARRIGLIQEVTENDNPLDAALAIANRIAEQAPLAVRETMASARRTIEAHQATEVVTMMEKARALMKTEDAAEGVRSFLQRRTAEFKGK